MIVTIGIIALIIAIITAYTYRKSDIKKSKDIERITLDNNRLYDQFIKVRDSNTELNESLLSIINERDDLYGQLGRIEQYCEQLRQEKSNNALASSQKIKELSDSLNNKITESRQYCEQLKAENKNELLNKDNALAESKQSYEQLMESMAKLAHERDCLRERAIRLGKACEQLKQEKGEAISDSNDIKIRLLKYAKKLAENEYKLEDALEQNNELNIRLENSNKLCIQLKFEIGKLTRESRAKQVEFAVREKQITDKEELINLKVKDIPVLAKHVADLKLTDDELKENLLRDKNRPALKAADIVREIKNEKYALNIKLKEAEYRVKYYEQVVPWLAEVDDDYLDPELNKTGNTDFDNNEDAASYWLSKDEFTQLTTQEKYQLALDRYKKRNKSNAEIGRDFERYVGYQYEKKGYAVEYRGIVDGFEDRGRDLLCHRGNTTLVIQCKYWSKKKEIHENHINQLFGTTVKYFLEKYPDATFVDFFKALQNKIIIPVFITSTVLSETAKEFAVSLNITAVENKTIGDYPIIKCNINKTSGEKIYHLPFDQQYDKVKINGKGECYAMTIAEAEEKGFRRAKRWLGE